MQKKNFCPYCGAKLSGEVRFCPQCGKKLEDDSINNSEEVSQEESIEENIPEQHSSGEIVSDNTPKKKNEGNEITEEFPDGLDENPSGIKKSKTPVFIKIIIGIVVAGLLFGLGYAELRKVMSSGADGKPRGLGRPSTQASIVTTLETRRYLERKGKSLIPTERGIHLISIFPIEDLKAPVMTAQWEKRLDDIEKGTDDYTSFITDLENSVRKWTKMIMELKSDDAEFQSNSSNYKCPICGRALLNFPWGYGCSGYQDDKCKFNIPRKIASKTLTEKQIQNLIQKGDSGYISGFVKNGGKTFGARIVIDKEEKKLKFANDVHGELLCPLCGKPLRKMAWGYGCSGYRETRCNFAIGTVAKKKLTDHQIKALLAGESVMVKGMKGKNGSFDAEVRLCNAGENKGKLQFIQN